MPPGISRMVKSSMTMVFSESVRRKKPCIVPFLGAIHCCSAVMGPSFPSQRPASQEKSSSAGLLVSDVTVMMAAWAVSLCAACKGTCTTKIEKTARSITVKRRSGRFESVMSGLGRYIQHSRRILQSEYVIAGRCDRFPLRVTVCRGSKAARKGTSRYGDPERQKRREKHVRFARGCRQRRQDRERPNGR